MIVKFLGGAHPIYQEMVNYPPNGVEYVGVNKSTIAGKYYDSKKTTSKISKLFKLLHLPRMFYVPNTKGIDLIHSSRGVLILNNKPWIMDIEHPASFTGMDLSLLKRSWLIRKIIEKKLASKNCKSILFHCKASLDKMEEIFDCSAFRSKMSVLYPASHMILLPRKSYENNQKIIILSVLTLFKEKGGVQVLEAFSRLNQIYPYLELWIKADVPENIKNKYNLPNIKYLPYKSEILPREELLKKYYSQADIFLYPTFADTFGYSLIDAKIAKLPIVASKNFAIPEIVKDGVSGITINNNLSYADKPFDDECLEIKEELVEEIVNNISTLIRLPKIRELLGEEGYKDVSEGIFSTKYRNKILKNVYDEAIKDN